MMRDNVEELVQMGYDRKEASDAYEKAQKDINVALNILNEKKPSGAPGKAEEYPCLLPSLGTRCAPPSLKVSESSPNPPDPSPQPATWRCRPL